MLREEWLRHAVEKLDANLFGGDLDILNKDYQITVGSTRWDLPAEVFLPYDGEDVTMDDFYKEFGIDPTTDDPDKVDTATGQASSTSEQSTETPGEP